MLTTITHDQRLRSRPLHTEKVDEDGTLWFIVNASTPKIDEIRLHEGRVCLSYADIEKQDYLSLSGIASLVDSPAEKAALWGAAAEIWFPNGKEDPAISLLKIVPHFGEYWDGPAGTPAQLLAFTKATLAGDVSGFGTHCKFEVTAD